MCVYVPMCIGAHKAQMSTLHVFLGRWPASVTPPGVHWFRSPARPQELSWLHPSTWVTDEHWASSPASPVGAGVYPHRLERHYSDWTSTILFTNFILLWLQWFKSFRMFQKSHASQLCQENSLIVLHFHHGWSQWLLATVALRAPLRTESAHFKRDQAKDAERWVIRFGDRLHP